MGNIDWSKAPEGATHFDPVDQNWLMQFLNISFGWLASEGWTTKGWQYPNDLSTMPRLITRPAWDGSGLPPVGVVCEAGIPHVNGPNNETRSVIWIEGRVIAYHAIKDKTYAWFAEDDGFYPPGVFEFRPIRTPEQIAAEERAAEIEEMRNIYAGSSETTISSGMSALYDAGYRKTDVQ